MVKLFKDSTYIRTILSRSSEVPKLNLYLLYFLVKNSKCEHLGQEGCCFYILMYYGYVHEGYASYGFCFDNKEKYYL